MAFYSVFLIKKPNQINPSNKQSINQSSSTGGDQRTAARAIVVGDRQSAANDDDNYDIGEEEDFGARFCARDDARGADAAPLDQLSRSHERYTNVELGLRLTTPATIVMPTTICCGCSFPFSVLFGFG